MDQGSCVVTTLAQVCCGESSIPALAQEHLHAMGTAKNKTERAHTHMCTREREREKKKREERKEKEKGGNSRHGSAVNEPNQDP